MSKAGRILGKIATGVAQVAVPAALADQAARLQAKRDERLQQYAQENQSAQNAYMSQENQLNRQAQTENAVANREQSQSQFDARMEFDQSKLELEGPEREARMALLQNQIEGSVLQNEINQISLNDTKAVQKLFNIMSNNDIPEAERAAATELYLLKVPAARREVIVKQLQDEFGAYTDNFAIFRKDTGERVDGGGVNEAGLTPAQQKQAEGYLRQLEAGDITEAQFDAKIEQLMGR